MNERFIFLLGTGTFVMRNNLLTKHYESINVITQFDKAIQPSQE